jgi:hypothetical protein
MELSVAVKPVILVQPRGAFHDRRRLADAEPFRGRAGMQLLAEEETQRSHMENASKSSFRWIVSSLSIIEYS